VYALDRATGKEIWRTQLPRRSEVQPLLVDGVLYVAARDHHVYALDAATGEVQEAPILTTGGKVSHAWAFDGIILYLADDLGKLYAIRLVEEEPALSPDQYIQAGQWEEAAAAWALQGEYVRAGNIYVNHLNLPFCAAQLYEKADEPLLAAVQYEAAGNPKRALELYRQARAWDKVAFLSESQGDLLSAAQAYEQLERHANAGECYYKLGKNAQAVAMYEEAARNAKALGDEQHADEYLRWAVKMYTDHLKQPAKAVMLLNEFGRKEEAKVVLKTIPGWKDEPALVKLVVKLVQKIMLTPQDRAQWYEQTGAFRLAADEYAKAGEHAKAAALQARVEEFTLAAEQYLQAGMPAKAADMMGRMGNWDEAAEPYLKADRRQEALHAYLKAGDNRHAAELFEQFRQWDQAAGKWAELGKWEQAAQAWERAQDFVQAAQAWIEEGDPMRAAKNYEEAARQQSLTDPNDREAMARLYELAMKQYRASGVKNKADFRDSQRRHYRKQPLIQVDAIHVGTLRTDELGKLDVIISNQGWGQAQDIRIQIATNYFELDMSRMEKSVGLAVGVQTKYTLWLEPRKAGQVPLHLTITYLDWKGHTLPELTHDTDIKVHRSGSKTSTPQVIQVQGDFIQGEHVHKQIGDRVDIRRGGRGITLDENESLAKDATELAVPTISCPYCGLEQPATNSRCENPRCEEPFIQCPSCGLYQPFDKTNQFCIHCGAHL
jgi:tetratricopeptide (TPR) repeat protein